MTGRQLTGILCGLVALAVGGVLLYAHATTPARVTVTPTWMHAQTEPVQYLRLYVVEHQQRQYLCEDLACVQRLLQAWWP